MFFTYGQNNSGGSFIVDHDAGIAHYVIVEAASHDEANRRALDIGIYFNGADDDGMDCPCCGDRWHEAYGEGWDKPLISGKPPNMLGNNRFWNDDVYIHYLDGRVEKVEQLTNAAS